MKNLSLLMAVVSVTVLSTSALGEPSIDVQNAISWDEDMPSGITIALARSQVLTVQATMIDPFSKKLVPIFTSSGTV
jgi:hypothetical protein